MFFQPLVFLGVTRTRLPLQLISLLKAGKKEMGGKKKECCHLSPASHKSAEKLTVNRGILDLSKILYEKWDVVPKNGFRKKNWKLTNLHVSVNETQKQERKKKKKLN